MPGASQKLLKTMSCLRTGSIPFQCSGNAADCRRQVGTISLNKIYFQAQGSKRPIKAIGDILSWTSGAQLVQAFCSALVPLREPSLVLRSLHANSRFDTLTRVRRYCFITKIVARASATGIAEAAAVFHGNNCAPNPKTQPTIIAVIGAVIKNSGVSA